MKKYATEELAQLYDKKDWATLWKIMTPMVKHAVRRCMQRGLDPYYVRDDLMQEAYLAAWAALPRWNAFEASLQKWVEENVRGAALKTNTAAANGMVGGRDSGFEVVSMHGETADDDGGDGEQELAYGPEAILAADTEDPTGEWLLTAVPLEDRDMVRRLAGIGVPRETQAEYATAEGISTIAVKKRMAALRQLFLYQKR